MSVEYRCDVCGKSGPFVCVMYRARYRAVRANNFKPTNCIMRIDFPKRGELDKIAGYGEVRGEAAHADVCESCWAKFFKSEA